MRAGKFTPLKGVNREVLERNDAEQCNAGVEHQRRDGAADGDFGKGHDS